MSEQQNIEAVRATYDAFNRGDLEGALNSVSDDYQITINALGVTMEGKEGFLQYLQGWARAMPNAQTEITGVVASGDNVVVEFRGWGKHTGPLATPAGEIPATGRDVDIRFCDVFDLRDGKVARQRNYFDSATLLRQLRVA